MNTIKAKIDEEAIASPLGPTFANIFLRYHKTKWLKNCPKFFQSLHYKRCDNGIFALLEKLE